MKIRDEAKAAADRLRAEYSITDAGGLELLATFEAAYSTELEAAELLEAEGLAPHDRFGQRKAHPAAAILRDARSQKLMALKALQLPIEEA